MPASFPTSVKVFTPVADGVDDISADDVNDLQYEVHAIEDYLWQNIARCSTAAGQVIANDAAHAIVDFDTVLFDPQSTITTGVAWKFTPVQSGYYFINCHITYASTANWFWGELSIALIYKNGVTGPVLYYHTKDGNTAHRASGTGGAMIYFDATVPDYIDVRVKQVSGDVLALYNDALYNIVEIFKVA